jgi:hypothetical protein
MLVITARRRGAVCATQALVGAPQIVRAGAVIGYPLTPADYRAGKSVKRWTQRTTSRVKRYV